MRIACLAWGSLIWKSGPLQLATPWMAGGPRLPIEFARVGDSGELATVIQPGAEPTPTHWAMLDAESLGSAREMLRRREGIAADQLEFAAVLPGAGPPPSHADDVAEWAKAHQFDGVVWTALPPRFDGRNGRAPTVDEAVGYLEGLQGDVRRHAEHYVRHVPQDIRTPYRAAIEARLGWLPEAQ